MLPSPHRLSATARTLISITTCSRPDYVRSQLPPFARCARELGDADVVLSVDGLAVRGNPEALEAALSFGVSCVVSDRAEGVGVKGVPAS